MNILEYTFTWLCERRSVSRIKIHLQWIIILNLWISSGTHLFSDFLPCHNNWFICFFVFTSKYACNKTVSFFISFFFFLNFHFRFQFLIQIHFYSASTLLWKSRFVFYLVPWELLYVLRWKVCRFLFFHFDFLWQFCNR